MTATASIILVATDNRDPRTIFGERVRTLRTKKSISQEKLADLAELDRTYISGVERGVRNISLLNIVKIADALEVNPSDLLKGL